MNDSELEYAIRHLSADRGATRAATIASARTSSDPIRLLLAALFGPDSVDFLGRAQRNATSTRDRQLVAIAAAYLARDHDRVGALIRDHLVDHPAHPILTWIVANTQPATGEAS